MKEVNKKYLDDHRGDFNIVVTQDYIPRRSMDMPAEIYRIIREEFNPNYFNDLDCPTCVFSIIKDGYKLYDNWLKVQVKELPRVVQAEPLVVATGFPANEGTTIAERAEKRKQEALKRHRK